MNPPVIDPAILTPNLSAADTARFLAYVAGAVWLPGAALCATVGLRVPSRIERWALAMVAGVLWCSACFLVLVAVGRQAWHLPACAIPVASFVLVRLAKSKHAAARNPQTPLSIPAASSRARWRRGWSFAQSVGLALLGGFLVYHVVRVASFVEQDGKGLRLYGPFHTDKFIDMSLCAALQHAVPPRHLRFDGHTFPNHYFPHLFVAASCHTTGIDYVDAYWFYAPAMGIAITGLAILASCRRWHHANGFGVAALSVYGVFRFGPEARALELSFALLLLALLAMQRFHAGRRLRWALLAAGAFGVMPLYYAPFAIVTLAGLVVWWILPAGRALRLCSAAVAPAEPPLSRLPPSRSNEAPSQLAWCTVGYRSLIVLPAFALALSAGHLLYAHEQVVMPPTVVAENTYRKYFKHRWRAWAQRLPLLATLSHWKDRKAVRDRGSAHAVTFASGTRPSVLHTAVAKIAYEAIFLGYFLVRFVNAGIFGAVTLLRRQPVSRRLRPIHSLLLVVVLIGYAIPWVLNFGQQAQGQWWWSADIYQPGNCAFLLLLLAGAPVMCRMAARWYMPRYWGALAIGVGSLAYAAWHQFALQPVTTYHFVPGDRLAAMAFLRTQVPYGEVVIHPWVDEPIRDERQGGQVSWVYKRHFTLGSTFAGQQMFYEGREEHLFYRGFVTPEEVYARSRARREFYAAGTSAAVERALAMSNVRWVVCDREHPAPPLIASNWPVAYSNDSVRIYRRPCSVSRPGL
ncbi:MAG: hypothetical protein HY000_12650 [Planctomycetes bacterium]|nr:hypothetical protein [Planctomycetota bacterium]